MGSSKISLHFIHVNVTLRVVKKSKFYNSHEGIDTSG